MKEGGGREREGRGGRQKNTGGEQARICEHTVSCKGTRAETQIEENKSKVYGLELQRPGLEGPPSAFHLNSYSRGVGMKVHDFIWRVIENQEA